MTITMRWVLLGLLSILLGPILFGQAESGTIIGVVKDPGGAVIPKATVTLVNEGTHFTRSVVTNAAGEYTAYSFPTGLVTATVQQPGFEKLVRAGVQLTVGQTLTLDLVLTVGNVQQEVEVTEQATLLQTQSAAVSNLVGNQQMLETPLNGRAFTQLMPIMAGAAPTTSGMTQGGGNERGNMQISVNGSVADNNTFLVDGLYNRDLWIDNLVIVPTLDSISDVRILSSNYDAEYGAAAGAMTLVQTKSGTNQWHGGAYEFLRNQVTDANTFFNNLNGIAKAPLHRNEYGGTVGGPIRKDKTFIFGDYQGIGLVQYTTTTSTIPTLAQDNEVLTGNFSSSATTLYNPYNVLGGIDSARVPFPNNQIPATLLDPLGPKLISLLPAPTSSAAANNYTVNPRSYEQDHQFDIRVDENVGASDRLFFKYSFDQSDATSGGQILPGPNAVINVGQAVTGGGHTGVQNWTAELAYTKVFSPTLVNEARVGVIRPNWGDQFGPGQNGPLATELGVPGLNLSDRSGGLPAYEISGFQTIGQSAQTPDENHTTSYQYEDIQTWVKGTHTLKFGGRYVRHDFNGFSAIAARGIFGFDGQYTRQAGASNGGSALADFALGGYDLATRTAQYGVMGMRMWETGFFAQDEWRVTNRLTLTYGLRHEMQSPPYEVNNQWSNFDVSTGQWLIAGVNDKNRALRNLYTHGFAPRLGIAYLLTKDGKTVLRTGGGFFYVESFNMGKQLFQNPPLSVNQAINTDQNAPPPATMAQGLPVPVEPNLLDYAAYSSTAFAYNPNLGLTRSMQWSIGIQRQLTPNMILDVSWVGNRTLFLENSLNANQAVPGPGSLQPRRPLYDIDPLLGDVDLRTGWGAAKYESMQTTLTKRYSKGLLGSIAWTWSHNLANAQEPATSVRPENSDCTACEWGNALQDRRHMVVINHVYELPFGAGRSYITTGPLAAIVGGWNLSGTWTMYTGQWFAAALGTPVSNTQSTGALSLTAATERPNWVSNPNVMPSGEQQNIYHWFNTAAFVVPQQYTFGNSGTGIILGPGYFNVDLGIHREFPIKERVRLTFRAELFNAFNRPNFNNPNATVGTSSEGTISSTLPARVMQFGLKLNF